MNRRHLMQAAVLATGAAVAPSAAPAAGPAPPYSRPAAIRTADGLSLAYEDWGAGPPMVLVHSWALQSPMWRQQVPALTDAGFRIVAFDRRGHGRSGGNGRGYDIDTLADDLAAVMDQLDLKEATLVGHSMASCEIVRYLSRRGSGRVARLVLLAPTTPYLIKAPDNPMGLPKEIFEQTRRAWRTDFTKWVSDNAAPFFVPETPQATRDWAIGMLLDCPLSVALATNLAVAGRDFRPDLAKVTAPTLVVHGDADVSAPLAITGAATAKGIRGARLQVLKGAPHGLFLTHAEAVNRAIIDFART